MQQERPIEEIKNQLRPRCAEIPLYIWEKRFPDLQIPLTEHLHSPLLPVSDSLEEDDVYRGVMGHDVVDSFLARNGLVLEKLIHYATDGYDSQTRMPDEFLGEASEEIYRTGYLKAKYILDLLVKDASIELSQSK
ncbi:MAG: hypothetical protein V1808_01145 [Candidatus Daviesbacteria bacterium]